DGEHDAQRLALDIAAEAGALLRHIGCQRLFGELHHVARTLLDPALLAPVADGTPHLPCELRNDLVVHRQPRLEKGQQIAASFFERALLPLGLCSTRSCQYGFKFSSSDKGTLCVDRAVDG